MNVFGRSIIGGNFANVRQDVKQLHFESEKILAGSESDVTDANGP